MTTITEKDYKTVEEETKTNVCDVCLAHEDELPEEKDMFEIDSNKHICADCIVNTRGDIVNYDEIDVKQSGESIELNISVDNESLYETLKSDESVRAAFNIILGIVLWPAIGAIAALECIDPSDHATDGIKGYGYAYIATLFWIFILFFLLPILKG